MICILMCVCVCCACVHVLGVFACKSICRSLTVCPFIAPHLSNKMCGRSQVFSRLVLRLCGGEVILQEGLQVLESVPLISLPPPALQHQFMERGGAARGTGHPVAPLHLLQHFTVVHA